MYRNEARGTLPVADYYRRSEYEFYYQIIDITGWTLDQVMEHPRDFLVEMLRRSVGKSKGRQDKTQYDTGRR